MPLPPPRPRTQTAPARLGMGAMCMVMCVMAAGFGAVSYAVAAATPRARLSVATSSPSPWLLTDCTVPAVAAAISDPFRKPDVRWHAGNRGIEYATVPNQPVVAVAQGTVSFAGTVANERYVTVAHGRGLRTSYAFLGDVTVAKGQVVTRGQTVGHTGIRKFHLGLRRGKEYLDPALLSAQVCRSGKAMLVPLDGVVDHR